MRAFETNLWLYREEHWVGQLERRGNNLKRRLEEVVRILKREREREAKHFKTRGSVGVLRKEKSEWVAEWLNDATGWVRVKIPFYFGYGDNFGLVKKVAVAIQSSKRYMIIMTREMKR